MNELPLIIIPSNVIKNDNKTEEGIFADESVQSKRESEEIVQEKKIIQKRVVHMVIIYFHDLSRYSCKHFI